MALCVSNSVLGQDYLVFCLHGSPRLFSLLVLHNTLYPSLSLSLSLSHALLFFNLYLAIWSHQAFSLFNSSPYYIDHGDQILCNCANNVHINSSLFNPQTVVNVRELNWMSEWPTEDSHCHCRIPDMYSWSSQDFEQVKNASFIFAADVIYSDDLTIALFSTLKRLMSFGCDKVLYLGLEKRYNFSLDDLNVVANGYACFRSYIKEDGLCKQEKGFFVGKRIDVTQIPRYMKDYDRGEDVELWEIKYVF